MTWSKIKHRTYNAADAESLRDAPEVELDNPESLRNALADVLTKHPEAKFAAMRVSAEDFGPVFMNLMGYGGADDKPDAILYEMIESCLQSQGPGTAGMIFADIPITFELSLGNATATVKQFDEWQAEANAAATKDPETTEK